MTSLGNTHNPPHVPLRNILDPLRPMRMIALHAVLIKSSLPHVSNSSIQLAYWTNAGSAAMVAIGEK